VIGNGKTKSRVDPDLLVGDFVGDTVGDDGSIEGDGTAPLGESDASRRVSDDDLGAADSWGKSAKGTLGTGFTSRCNLAECVSSIAKAYRLKVYLDPAIQFKAKCHVTTLTSGSPPSDSGHATSHVLVDVHLNFNADPIRRNAFSDGL